VGLYTRLAPLPPASPSHVEAGAHIEPEGGGQGGA
jgi:hypothetical protein